MAGAMIKRVVVSMILMSGLWLAPSLAAEPRTVEVMKNIYTIVHGNGIDSNTTFIITSEGVIVIKAQSYRSQDKNKQEALDRLDDLLSSVQRVKKARKPTRPTRGSIKRQHDSKRKRSDRKRLRGKVDY